MKKASENLQIQKWVAAISVILLAVKFFAYYKTHSVSILTDALESIVNVVAGFIGLYSLYVAAKPRDADHPYGHGKAEFLSAAVEGTLILGAGVMILYKAIVQIIFPVGLEKIDQGAWLIGITAIINAAVGYYCLRAGKRNDSMALQASGRHLLTDTLSTIAVVAGLVTLYLTDFAPFFDGVLAAVLGLIILWSGYKVLRPSIAGIMDEADKKVLERMVRLLDANRQPGWVDMHNLRVIRYGSVLHVDCHLTVPWYFNVNEAHQEVDTLSALVRKEFGESVELFVHSDGCLYTQCSICIKADCPVRKMPFERQLAWELDNISRNQKHELNHQI